MRISYLRFFISILSFEETKIGAKLILFYKIDKFFVKFLQISKTTISLFNNKLNNIQQLLRTFVQIHKILFISTKHFYIAIAKGFVYICVKTQYHISILSSKERNLFILHIVLKIK